MEELATCSMNCQNKAIYICGCSEEQIFLCSNHTGPHLELVSAGKHLFTRIKIPEKQTKNIISGFLKGLKHQIKQGRVNIIQESSLLINQIKEAANNSLRELSLIERKLDEYVNICDTLEEINNLNSGSFIESLLKLSAEEAEKIKYMHDIISINSANLKESIENLFTVQKAASLLNIDNFKPKIIKYFKGQDLFAVDLISQDSAQLNINKTFTNWYPTCLLENGFVFYCSQSDTFIINSNNAITPLDSSKFSDCSGLIAVDDFVYMFGGTGNAYSKFSLKSKKWTPLAQYPVSNNRFISCAYINNVILMGGYESPIIYGYIVLSNLYAAIPITLNSNTAKTCLATENQAFIIEYSKHYYESGLNDINSWTLIGAANMLDYAQPRHSYSLLYKDSFYFITTNLKLIQFNLKSKKLEHLKTL